jgi:hypothetical protein
MTFSCGRGELRIQKGMKRFAMLFDRDAFFFEKIKFSRLTQSLILLPGS